MGKEHGGGKVVVMVMLSCLRSHLNDLGVGAVGASPLRSDGIDSSVQLELHALHARDAFIDLALEVDDSTRLGRQLGTKLLRHLLRRGVLRSLCVKQTLDTLKLLGAS